MWWHCNNHWGDIGSGLMPESPPVGLRRGQHFWAALQRAAMLGCPSLNVWIQCTQAGDFTTNSERQQSTEGAWSWAVAWSVCEITKRWREYYFCFQGVLFGCILFFPAVQISSSFLFHSLCAAIPPCKHSDYLQIFLWTLYKGKYVKWQWPCSLSHVKVSRFLAGMCARVEFWVWFAWIHASWATGPDKTSKPTPNLPFYSGFTVKPP